MGKSGRRTKPLTARLHKSKNFLKLDRNLDAFINGNKDLMANEKHVLRMLLSLRGRDDSNEVKTTISGLTALLAVNIKTVRSALSGLCAKEFLIYERDEFEPGCNYQKRVFSFPETFPGFDATTVFIRRGDKQKAKMRKESADGWSAIGLKISDLKHLRRLERETKDLPYDERMAAFEPEHLRLACLARKRLDEQREKAKAERVQRVTVKAVNKATSCDLTQKGTYPECDGLLDRAFNKVVRKNTSYSCSPNFVETASPRLAAPNAENADLFEREDGANKSHPHSHLEAAGERPCDQLPSIVSLQPHLRSLILSVLSQARQREQIRKLIGLIDYWAATNPYITTLQDRYQLAKYLDWAFKETFLTNIEQPRSVTVRWGEEPPKRKVGYNLIVKRMFDFFRRCVANYEPMYLDPPVEDDGDDLPFCRIYDDSIIGTHPELPLILETIMESAKAPNLIPSLSDYIDKLVDENGMIEGKRGRQEIADVLLEKLYRFNLYEGHKRIILPRLYRFLDGFINTFMSRSFTGNRLQFRYDLREEHLEQLNLEFPWLDPEYRMTARQQQRAKRAIKRLKAKLLSWRSMKGRMEESGDERICELAA